MKTWKRLYDKSSTGKIKEWQISVFEMGNNAEIKIINGYINGKKTVRTRVVDKGKNIGKVNSTTPYTQACSDAQSKWNKKIDSGYVSQVSQIGSKTILLPMLAQTYYSKTHPKVVKGEVKETKVLLPLIVQPKLNGVRCIAIKEIGVVKITSRKGKDYTKVCSKLANQLRLVMKDGDIWDGEIYVHSWSFQRIIRAVKKERLDTRKLQFHRFDVCNLMDYSFHNRAIYMATKLKTSKYIIQTKMKIISEPSQIKEMHDEYVKDGYEGLILRDPEAKYVFKHRVKGLLKYKEFEDKEFKIWGYWYDNREDGTTQRRCIRFKCRSKTGIIFDVIPQGSLKQREYWYNDEPWKFVGKDLTVRYRELSEDGVPTVNPVGIVRDYE